MSPASRAAQAAAMILCGALLVAAEPSPEAAAALERGRELLAEQQFPEAVAAFRQATKLSEGGCFDCLMGLAAAWRGTHQYDRSAEACREALRLDLSRDQQVLAYNDLGIALFSLAHTPTLDEYRTAQRLQGTKGQAPKPRAWISNWDERRLRLFREAASTFRQALEASGGEANVVRYSLAETLFRLGDFDAAKEQIAEHLKREAEASPAALELDYCLGVNWEDASGREEFPIPMRDDDPVLVDDSIEPPKKLVAPTPEYPLAARRVRIRGAVDVLAVIDREGNVRCPRVVKSLPLVDRAALDTVRLWKFEPARKDGELVGVFYHLRVNFRLRRP